MLKLVENFTPSPTGTFSRFNTNDGNMLPLSNSAASSPAHCHHSKIPQPRFSWSSTCACIAFVKKTYDSLSAPYLFSSFQ
ncbi:MULTISPECIES: hypothetical protein [Alistipes]|jgi:hypothetical protein|uniref:Uncharacterized protein n=1 Tax=Alistipes hominis TaxID=2763015 RepID=A0ABR7CMC2_9BACT|nr:MULTISPECIES: hypothetical protein [Alistipes]MBC5616806.1 hypothetical protein [Alistipes hominis]QGA23020.1 hypothetical protein GFH31_03760 [Alistipes sp. dk3624]